MKQFNHEDKIFVSCCMLAILLSCTVFLWNLYHQDYYLDFQWMGGIVNFYFIVCCVFLYFIFIVLPIPHSMPSALIKALAMLIITLSIMEFCNTAILTTPFATHDQLMVTMDRLLGFHLLPLLQMLHTHTTLNIIIWYCYFSLLLVIHCLPISLAITEKKCVSYHYFCSFLISMIMGYGIYYFFPTMTSPASVYPHQYFTAFQLNTLRQFQLEHLHKIIHFNLVGGIVSFPSFHAIWGTLVVYFLWPYGRMKYVGLLYGMLIMCVAIITGWHYLVDIFGGIAVGAVSIMLSNFLLNTKQAIYARSNGKLITS